MESKKKKDNIKVLAGIVSFNPDVDRLKENVESIIYQVDSLAIVDNGSNNLSEIKKKLKNFEINYIENNENLGIAKALSQIMDYAIENSYDWALTLDDDSVAMPKLIENYKKYINVPNVASMTCMMEDRNYSTKEKEIDSEYIYTQRFITSGCFMSVDAYKHSDGYSVDLFIDRVDDDICYNLTSHGYKHIKINYVGLLHEMGFGVEKKFLWHTARAVNYSPFRRYYIFRNETIIRNKYPGLIKREWLESGRPMWINFALSSLKIILYEDNKKEKIKSSWRGWKDGRKYVKEKIKAR